MQKYAWYDFYHAPSKPYLSEKKSSWWEAELYVIRKREVKSIFLSDLDAIENQLPESFQICLRFAAAARLPTKIWVTLTHMQRLLKGRFMTNFSRGRFMYPLFYFFSCLLFRWIKTGAMFWWWRRSIILPLFVVMVHLTSKCHCQRLLTLIYFQSSPFIIRNIIYK